MPSAWQFGAEDGIRTRDPHLGKVMDLVQLVPCSPPTCGSVGPVSTPSNASAAVVERSTTLGVSRARMAGGHQYGKPRIRRLGLQQRRSIGPDTAAPWLPFPVDHISA